MYIFGNLWKLDVKFQITGEYAINEKGEKGEKWFISCDTYDYINYVINYTIKIFINNL